MFIFLINNFKILLDLHFIFRTVLNHLLILLLILTRKMMRKIPNVKVTTPTPFQQAKQLSHSLSTEQSPRQNRQLNINKEKSQLCKKFTENGYCPYQKRCKFAHGLQELKKNDQTNCRYKTRVCGGYLQEGYCPFGNRCNFIHPNTVAVSFFNRTMDFDLLNIKATCINTSRLLRILKKE